MKISFKWIGGATWILSIDTVKIACDPVLCPKGTVQDYTYFKTKRVNEPMYDESDFQNIDLWLLTHNHEDHIDAKGLKMIRNDSAIISHKSVRPLLNKEAFSKVQFLGRDEETAVTLDEIIVRIKAVPATHAKRRLFSSMVGNGNGYLLQIIKNNAQYCIYVTGDSVYHKGIKKHIDVPGIDLIIANAGSAMVGKSFLASVIGRITNNINDLIKMDRELKPKKIIPVHWGTFTHYSENITPELLDKYGTIEFLNPGERIQLN